MPPPTHKDSMALEVASLEFVDHGADQATTGRTQRVAQRRTTHDIGNLVADIKIFHITECNRSEGFIDLPKIDVVGRQPRL